MESGSGIYYLQLKYTLPIIFLSGSEVRCVRDSGQGVGGRLGKSLC